MSSDQDRILWEYVDLESDELLLEVAARVAADGFSQASGERLAVADEVLALKVLTSATVKQLAILVEKINHPSLVLAYVQMLPMVVDMVKYLEMRRMRDDEPAR